MKFIDILIEATQKAVSKPEQEKEILYFFLMDLALKSRKLSERKAWETLASLVAIVWKDRKFPSNKDILAVKASINSKFRENIPRTSGSLFSIRKFELGEAALKKFFNETAWKGMPGFEPDGTPMR